ncbi:hypothetical protein [Sinimarinibacterium flocculans]|uniref:hypothetical protein n=1 Tax=Sinimarinibacterium flocculans TaxID=985250 RepID=UPI0035123E88
MRSPALAVAAGATLALLAACSNRGVYEGTQAWRAQDCDVQSSRTERDDCREQARLTYPEYEKERDEALAER